MILSADCRESDASTSSYNYGHINKERKYGSRIPAPPSPPTPSKSRSTHPVRQRDSNSEPISPATSHGHQTTLFHQSPMKSSRPSSAFLSKGKMRLPPPSPSAAASDRFDQTSVGRKRPPQTYAALMSDRPQSAKAIAPDARFAEIRPLYEARRRSRSASQAGARYPSATEGSRLESQYTGLLQDLEALERLAETSTGRLSRGRALSSRRESRVDQPPVLAPSTRQQHHVLVEAEGDMEDDDLFTWHVPEDVKLKAWMWGNTQLPAGEGIRAVSSPTVMMAAKARQEQLPAAHPRSESKFKDQETMPSLSPLSLRQRMALEQHLARRGAAAAAAAAAVAMPSPPSKKKSSPNNRLPTSPPPPPPHIPPPSHPQKKAVHSSAPPSPGLTKTRFGGWIETNSIPSAKSPARKHLPVDPSYIHPPIVASVRTLNVRPAVPATRQRDKAEAGSVSLASSCSELMSTSALVNPRRFNDEGFDIHPDSRLLPLPIDSFLLPLHKHTISNNAHKTPPVGKSLTPPRAVSPLVVKIATTSDDAAQDSLTLTFVSHQLHQLPEHVSQELPAASAFVTESAHVDDIFLMPSECPTALNPLNPNPHSANDQEALDLVNYRMTMDSEVPFHRQTEAEVEVLPAYDPKPLGETSGLSAVEGGVTEALVVLPSKKASMAPYQLGKKIWNAFGRRKKESQGRREASVQEPRQSREAASSTISPIKKESLCLANPSSKAVGDTGSKNGTVSTWTKWAKDKGKRVFGR